MGEISIAVKQRIISFISFIGIILTLIEITCYVIIFHHIHHHNNNIGAVVLSEKIIKHRNRTNAISFFGQFLAWVMRIWYVVIFIFVFHVKISLREIIPMIKNLFWSRWWKFTHQLRSKLFEQITKSVLVNKTNICRLKLFWNIKRSLYSWVVNHLTLGTKCDDSNSLFFKEVSWCALLYQDHNGEE